MKKIKQQIALILSILMVISSMPFTAFALDANVDRSGSNTYCEWNYTAETDTLYINGPVIAPYESSYITRLPLYSNAEDGSILLDESWDGGFSSIIFGKDVEEIQDCYLSMTAPESITFEEGSQLKKIGANAFSGIESVTSIELPETLESIGNKAFYSTLFTEINIPKSVKSIGNYAFQLSAITHAELPEIENVGNGIFEECYYLESVDLGNTITDISDNMFQYCESLKSIVIPDSVIEIGRNAFSYCTSLTDIQFSNNLEYIGYSAFLKCSKLNNLNFPDSLYGIDRNAFNSCTALKNVDFAQVCYIEYRAFYGDTALESIVLPSSVDSIGDSAFESCSALSEVVIEGNPEYGTYIGKSAFKSTAIKEINLPAYVYEIDNYAFTHAGNLSTVTFETKEVNGEIIGLRDIGVEAFGVTNIKELVLPSTLESIGKRAFYYTLLERVDMSQTQVATINEGLFTHCEQLTDVKFPNHVDEISSTVFNGCSSLTTVEFGAESTFTEIPNSMFADCTSLENVVLPESVKTIGTSAFENCTNLDLVIPTSVTTIGDSAFRNTNISNLDLRNNTDLTSIGTYAFADTSNLGYITLPEGLNRISDYAFYKTNVAYLELPDSITTIAPYAFAESDNLFTVKLPLNLTDINKYAFNKCHNLYKADFGNNNSLKGIGAYAFEETALREIDIPDSCTNIYEGVFKNCLRLKDVDFPTNIASIGSDAFLNVPITTAQFDKLNVTMSTSKLFTFTDTAGNVQYNVSGLIKCLPGSTAYDYAKAHGIPYQLSMNIDNEPTLLDSSGTWEGGTWEIAQIKNYYENKTYQTLTIYGKGDIKNNTFTMNNGFNITVSKLAYAFGVEKVDIATGITAIPDNFLYDNTSSASSLKITVLNIPYGVTTIGKNAFRGLKIASLFIPNSVTEIGEYAFAYTDLSRECVLSNRLKTINKGVFANTKVTSVTLPDSITTICEAAFLNSSSLTKINIPISVTDIYYNPTQPERNPIGFLSDGTKTTKPISIRINSAGYDYVKKADLPYDFGNGKQKENGYFYVANGTKKWEYDEATKTVTLDGVGKLNGDYFYYSDGNLVRKGDFEVDKIIVGGEITDIVGDIKTSVFAIFNPKYIELPENTTYLNQYAFKDCTNLESIVLPDYVSEIESQTFANCTSLQAVTFGSELKTIPAETFRNSKSLKLVDFGGVQTIGDRAFQNCSELKQINLPDSVKTVGRYAFYKCVNVQSLTIGSGLSVISQNAFADFPFCQTITINNPNFNKIMSDNEFKKYDIFKNIGVSTTGATLVIGDKLTSPDLRPFEDKNITTLKLGKNVTSVLTENTIKNLKDIVVSEQNKTLYSYEHCLYGNDNELKLVPAKLDKVNIKDTTVKIGDGAFKKSVVQSVDIPVSVKEIGTTAFMDCSNLKKVELPKGTTTIGDRAFEGCDSIRVFYMSSTIRNIGNRAFADCVNLASIILPSKLVSIGNEAFEGDVSLAGIVIPEDVQSIGDRAFANCDTLKEIYIWNAALGSNVFEGTENVKIHTMLASDAYAYARENNIPYATYTDEDIFYEICGIKLEELEGYIGFCTDGHGDIQYLTVYEADCENDGYVIGVCEYCSEILEEKHIDAFGHDYRITADIAATDTTKGMVVHTCSKCKKSYCDYTPATGSDVQTQTHTVNGSVVIADNRTANSGMNHVKGVDIIIDGYVVATTDDNGQFSFTIESGIYTATLHYAFGFDRTVYFVVEDQDINCSNITIIGCDFNKDGKVDNTDYELFKVVISAKVNDHTYLDYVDMNSDGVINVKDMVIIRNCMGIDASTYDYPTIVVKK